MLSLLGSTGSLRGSGSNPKNVKQAHRNVSPGRKSRIWSRSMEIILVLEEWLYWELQKNKWEGKTGHKSWGKVFANVLMIQKKRGWEEWKERTGFPKHVSDSEVGEGQGFNCPMENSLPHCTMFVMLCKFSCSHAGHNCLWSRFYFGDNTQINPIVQFF